MSLERLGQSNLIERQWEDRDNVSSQEASSALKGESMENGSNTSEYFVSSTDNDVNPMNKPKIWAVGSGKGGVGKSLISASFSLSLAKRGFRVLAIDLDIGGSNLHTCLGVAPPKVGLGDWVCRRIPELEGVMVPTLHPNLKLISGANDSTKITEIMNEQSDEICRIIRSVKNFDHVVIDLGAGTYELTTKFFLAADDGVISILPEPTSVENAYRFIRSVLYKKLRATQVSEGIREVIDAASDPKNILGIKTPADLLAVIARIDDSAAIKIRAALQSFHPHIVVNQVRSQVDVDVGRAITSVCRRFFGIEVNYAGYIDYDNSVWKAVRDRQPAILEFPRSVLANRVEHLTEVLLNHEKAEIDEQG